MILHLSHSLHRKGRPGSVISKHFSYKFQSLRVCCAAEQALKKQCSSGFSKNPHLHQNLPGRKLLQCTSGENVSKVSIMDIDSLCGLYSYQ